MLEFLQAYWVWIVFGLFFLWMMRMHGGGGGCGMGHEHPQRRDQDQGQPAAHESHTAVTRAEESNAGGGQAWAKDNGKTPAGRHSGC
ncbi:MAG: hypothetical protein KGJ86_15720 [Chloroflexota bacterium]|nr:hypothetical protein [Chloroflexota bacterium]